MTQPRMNYREIKTLTKEHKKGTRIHWQNRAACGVGVSTKQELIFKKN